MALMGFDCVWISSVEFVVTLGWRKALAVGRLLVPHAGLGGRLHRGREAVGVTASCLRRKAPCAPRGLISR